MDFLCSKRICVSYWSLLERGSGRTISLSPKQGAKTSGNATLLGKSKFQMCAPPAAESSSTHFKSLSLLVSTLPPNSFSLFMCNESQWCTRREINIYIVVTVVNVCPPLTPPHPRVSLCLFWSRRHAVFSLVFFYHTVAALLRLFTVRERKQHSPPSVCAAYCLCCCLLINRESKRREGVKGRTEEHSHTP